MLFFCGWRHVSSLVVDARDEAHAREIAKDIHDERKEPERLVPLEPGAFVIELEDESDGSGDDEAGLVLCPLPHTEDLLIALEDAPLGEGEVIPIASTSCGREADGEEGLVYVCDLEVGHAGACQARDASGHEIASWSDEGE